MNFVAEHRRRRIGGLVPGHGGKLGILERRLSAGRSKNDGSFASHAPAERTGINLFHSRLSRPGAQGPRRNSGGRENCSRRVATAGGSDARSGSRAHWNVVGARSRPLPTEPFRRSRVPPLGAKARI